MVRIKVAEGGIFVEKGITNLDAVTSATDGDAINVELYDSVSVYVTVSGNTGAVTVNIESSPSGLFAGEEVGLDNPTYTAENTIDKFTYAEGDAGRFIRVTTTTQSSSTVSAILTARGS